jgi:twitching motility protein PilI
MAKRISLREFQSQLTARLGSAQRGETTRALLGIESGKGADAYWLLDLTDSGEIAPLSAVGGLLPVALTKPWFAGVINIRGVLYSVVDFSAFRGGEPTPRNADTRLLLVGARHGINSALLVTRTLGLRPPADLTLQVDAVVDPSSTSGNTSPSWLGQSYTDADGRHWQHLLIPALLADPAFLDIAA